MLVWVAAPTSPPTDPAGTRIQNCNQQVRVTSFAFTAIVNVSTCTPYAIDRRMNKISHCNAAHSQVDIGVQLSPAECHLVAEPSAELRVDGNLARRTSLPAGVYWDNALPGFGLRVRSSGHKSWVIKLRERGSQKYLTLGEPEKLAAPAARKLAQSRLANAMLDGLPQRPKQATEQTFSGYAERFWSDYARHWKPSTERRNARCLRCDLLPWFGDISLASITRSDVIRWRDSLAGSEATFNRALPVLSVMLGYAEQAGLRRAGSNPCKGTPRYSRDLPDRYLSGAEYRRLARVLTGAEEKHPSAVTAVRLLMFTGARSDEIMSLRWEYVDGTRLNLPDSKTGPKTVWLNQPALKALDVLPRSPSGPLFPAARVAKPMQLYPHWDRFRRQAALPDVRLHDLRHSFASIAIANGIPLTMIGRLLGHALPETTARYAHLADDVIADAAARVSGGIAEALGLGR